MGIIRKKIVRFNASCVVAGVGLFALFGCANDLIANQAEMRQKLTTLYQDQILQSLAAMKAGSMPLLIGHGDIKQTLDSEVGASFGYGDNDSFKTTQEPDGDDVLFKIENNDNDEASVKLDARVKGASSLTTKIVGDPKLYQQMRKFADERVLEKEPDAILHTITIELSKYNPRTYFIANDADSHEELGAIFERFVTGKDPEKDKPKFASKHTLTVVGSKSEVLDGYVIIETTVAPPMPAFHGGECVVNGHTFTLLDVKNGSDTRRNIVWLGTPADVSPLKEKQGDSEPATTDSDKKNECPVVAALCNALTDAKTITVAYNPPPKEKKESDRWDNLADAFINLPRSVEKLKP